MHTAVEHTEMHEKHQHCTLIALHSVTGMSYEVVINEVDDGTNASLFSMSAVDNKLWTKQPPHGTTGDSTSHHSGTNTSKSRRSTGRGKVDTSPTASSPHSRPENTDHTHTEAGLAV